MTAVPMLRCTGCHEEKPATEEHFQLLARNRGFFSRCRACEDTRIVRLGKLDEIVPPDTGCPAGGPSCLACILPECVEDMTPAKRDAEQRQRDQAIYRDYIAAKSGPNPLSYERNILALVQKYGVSRRTISRAIVSMKGEKP